MLTKLVKGNRHEDLRGTLFYNNDFDMAPIKRIYIIENKNIDIIRAWQGHVIEQRWFSALKGSFKIELIAIDDWNKPNKKLERLQYILDATKLDILHVPSGCISSIQSLEDGAKLLVMADYLMGEIQDQYRFPVDYFD